MPTTITYPGVYVEEISSRVRTIVGVATSITAFIGSARSGPVNVPVPIQGLAEYGQVFGVSWAPSSMGFAVRDFFFNGGQQAIIVRVHNGAKPATFRIPTGIRGQVLQLEAAGPGAWGNDVRVQAGRYPNEPALFRFAAEAIDPDMGLIIHGETYEEVSITPDHPRFLPLVLERESSLVRVVKSNGRWVVPQNIPISSTKLKHVASGTDGRTLTKTQILKGLTDLDQCDLLNLLCIPPYRPDGDVDKAVISAAASYCEARRAFFILDSPTTWTDVAKAEEGIAALGTTSANAALYFPRIKQSNLLKPGTVETFASCGAVAGVFARTDANRGVWKAPAGTEASIVGVDGLSVAVNDTQNGQLNPLAVNCLRSFPSSGIVVWGSRTLQGADSLASEWKYIPVRRTALFIEESICRGVKWAVFEPNDEPLWAQMRRNVGAFMQSLFRQGAFQGSTPREAYFVKCDSTTQSDTDLSILNILVGFAPLKPAEFIVITIRQIAGQTEQ